MQNENLFTYSEYLNIEPRYYVYLHKDKNGNIFYIGKGTTKRAWSKQGRNLKWKEKAKEGYTVHLVYTGLTEEWAYAEEMFLIEKYKQAGLPIINVSAGGPCRLVTGPQDPEVNRRRSETLKRRAQEGRWAHLNRRGENNSFYGKTHSEKTKARLKEIHYSPITCTNIDTKEEFVVSGTREASSKTGMTRNAIQRALRRNSGQTLKTSAIWRFVKNGNDAK